MVNNTQILESSSSYHMASNVSYVDKPSKTWIVDIVETNHMVGDHEILHDNTLVGNAGNIQLPTRDSAKVSHVGSCQLYGGDTISDVLCVPTFRFNLLFASKLTKALKLLCCLLFIYFT